MKPTGVLASAGCFGNFSTAHTQIGRVGSGRLAPQPADRTGSLAGRSTSELLSCVDSAHHNRTAQLKNGLRTLCLNQPHLNFRFEKATTRTQSPWRLLSTRIKPQRQCGSRRNPLVMTTLHFGGTRTFRHGSCSTCRCSGSFSYTHGDWFSSQNACMTLHADERSTSQSV